MINTIGYGESDSLRAIFEGLRQTESMRTMSEQGYVRKFRDKDIDELKKYISSRNYGFVCREMLFLSWAVVHTYKDEQYGDPLFSYFWMDEITTPERCRSAFTDINNDASQSVQLDQNKLKISINDTHFDINISRAGILAVMMEFVITVVMHTDPNYNIRSDIQNCLLSADAKEIGELNKRIMKLIFDYLKQHMPDAPEQERYKYCATWMNQNQLTPEQINDEHILQFWQDANNDSSPNKPSHVTYKTAMNDVLTLLSVLKVLESQKQLHYGASIGDDFEQQEVSLDNLAFSSSEQDYVNWGPQTVHQTLFESSELNINLQSFSQTPKCLSKDHIKLIEPIVEHHAHIKKFHLSLLRSMCFSLWQGALTQAKRVSAEQLKNKLNDLPTNGYVHTINELEAIDKVSKNSILALVHVFSLIEPIYALRYILQTIPSEDAHLWFQQQPLNDLSFNKLIALINEAKLKWPTIANAYKQAEKAFKSNNKAGFKHMPEASESENYVYAFEQLELLTPIVQNFLTCTNTFKNNSDHEAKFSSDAFIFSQRFKHIYGDVNVTE